LTLAQYARLAAIIFVVLLFPAGFIVGCVDEKDRFDTYRDQVKAAGEAQEKWTAGRILADKKLKKDTDDAWKKRMARLNREHDAFAAELLASAHLGLMPPAGPAAPGSGGAEEDGPNVVCFARDRLSEGISRELSSFAGRYAGGVQVGASAIAGFKACTEWALEASQASPPSPADRAGSKPAE
jgi:hypothetical protein